MWNLAFSFTTLIVELPSKRTTRTFNHLSVSSCPAPNLGGARQTCTNDFKRRYRRELSTMTTLTVQNFIHRTGCSMTSHYQFYD